MVSGFAVGIVVSGIGILVRWLNMKESVTEKNEVHYMCGGEFTHDFLPILGLFLK